MQTEQSEAVPPTRTRRWFQFSLRTLLIFTLICAVAAGWLGKKIERKHQEQVAVDAIRKLGGYAYYDYQIGADGKISPRGEPSAPPWLRMLLGEGFFNEVEIVSLPPGPEVTDAALEGLKELKQLRFISLRDTRVSDAGLASLKGLTQLNGLNLSRTNVSGAGLENLSGLPQLQSLELEGANISDAGVAALKGLTQLQWLYLSGTKVTDADFNELQKSLPNCSISR
jgi:Leucine-rich repeat (LRR) protein